MMRHVFHSEQGLFDIDRPSYPSPSSARQDFKLNTLARHHPFGIFFSHDSPGNDASDADANSNPDRRGNSNNPHNHGLCHPPEPASLIEALLHSLRFDSPGL